MTLRALVLILALSPWAGIHAQTSDDKAAVLNLPAQYEQAWAKHDGSALTALMSDDIDWINVGAAWFQGKRDFQTYHSRLLQGRFKGASLTILERAVRFIRPDLAMIRCSWKIEGDRNFDGTSRPPRTGLMSLLAEKRGERWLIIAGQNTNRIPGSAPEEEGIDFPIDVPDLSATKN